MKHYIKADQIETKFPFGRDEKFIELYGQVAKGKLPYYWALIKMAGIKPFTNVEVEVDDLFKDNFMKKFNDGKAISIHVYQDGDIFIMSDDYQSYTLYKELGVNPVPCVVMGEPSGDYVVEKIKISYQPLTIEVLR